MDMFKSFPGQTSPGKGAGMTRDQERLFAHLEALGIRYEHLRHEPLHGMGECAELAKAHRALYPKNVFLCNRSQTAFYLAVMDAGKRFATGEVSRQAGSSRLSFGPDEALEGLLRVRPGAVTPFSLLFGSAKDVGLIVDETLKGAERLCFHPFINDETVIVSGADFFGRFLPGLDRRIVFVRMNGEE